MTSRKPRQPSPIIPLFDLTVSSVSKRNVERVLTSGWLSTGPVTASLETEIAKTFQVPFVAAVSSATAGLVAALKAAKVGPGDEVILPSFTFIATAEAVMSVGATVRFADIDPLQWSLDPSHTSRLINKRTRAIIPVDFAGVPVDYLAFRRLSDRHKLSLISDSSHALGATLNKKPISSYSDFAVFSLHVTKNLTSAEGGLVFGATKRQDQLIRVISRHGISRNAWQRRSKGSAEYDVTISGLKGNLPDLLAALALGELQSFKRYQHIRQKLVQRYIGNLAPYHQAIQTIQIPKLAQPSWHLFPIRLRKVQSKSQRDKVLSKMKALGVECGMHYRPLHQMTLFRNHPDRNSLPVSGGLGQSNLVLPLYPLLTSTQVDSICEKLLKTLRELRLT